MDWQLSAEQQQYVKRLAYRYVRYRKSASIDAEDLISAAISRWWQFCQRKAEAYEPEYFRLSFFHQVKGAMRDAVRASSPVKVTRTMQSKLQAYQTPTTVSLEHVIDVQAGDQHEDLELWMDVIAGLRNLSQRDQIILTLYFERDFTFSEIAEVLEVAVSTVTRAYQRAIETLKRELQDSRAVQKNG